MKHIQLPALAFGQASAHVDISTYAMQERLKLLGNGLHTYESLAKPGEFIHQSFFTNINGLTIGTVASTPIRVDLKKVNTPMLLIPLSGSGSYRMGSENLIWRAADQAVLLPCKEFSGESSMRSTLVVFINPDRLEATARGMTGIRNQETRLIDLERPKQVSLQYGCISFDRIFRQLTGLINEIYSQQELLKLSGVDDGIYRAMVMMLNPNLFKIEVASAIPGRYSRNLIDQACQYIQANHHQAITLSELEHVSGMSERTLQLAFQKRFQCTPMQWIRMLRLDSARERLINPSPGTTVTAIAFICGFNKPSTFAHYYKQRFRELPSTTLANREVVCDTN